ncbi:hypothetical protein [Antrihabitans sp. YC2-6]|uniref:hypothetical protein n=1 Tax=Antrihabitans sp. YC2-6 TaxID=2799498 RepID=UPI0018F5C667|nr:hypothetical protein [Antrihabitans sp. YC2-6]MBJ8344836.1 hypothetical protein [Antrihabitans sp. YC2-6]
MTNSEIVRARDLAELHRSRAFKIALAGTAASTADFAFDVEQVVDDGMTVTAYVKGPNGSRPVPFEANEEVRVVYSAD